MSAERPDRQHQPTPADVGAAAGALDERPLLEARELHRSFGSTPALAGAGMSIGPGELVAVTGPSGSGKSTLLNCLAGILVPDSGTVEYAGSSLSKLPDHDRTALRRTEFGFVFQFGQLVPELSALENVALPLRLSGVRRRAAERKARQWLANLEVDDVADHRAGEMSGGQGQRVAIARALVMDPHVVFADEPTGSLDSLSGERVMNLLVESARDAKAAVVLVTHEPRVAAYADREVVVRDGQTR